MVPSSFLYGRVFCRRLGANIQLSERKRLILDLMQELGAPHLDGIPFFANSDIAQRWFEEHVPEGVAFEYQLIAAN